MARLHLPAKIFGSSALKNSLPCSFMSQLPTVCGGGDASNSANGRGGRRLEQAVIGISGASPKREPGAGDLGGRQTLLSKCAWYSPTSAFEKVGADPEHSGRHRSSWWS